MKKLRVLDLFAGIGGFSLGLERTGGFSTVAFCEIEPFPRKVLAKHWPEVPCYEDVRTLTRDILDRDGISVDVITGGFPCQDISTAGKQAGIGEGTRSGLWSEIVRLIGELRPQYVIVENVANLLSGPSEQRGGWFGRILGDLAECGYDAEWEIISAASMGAPHVRKRVWVVAYPASERRTEARQTGERSAFWSAGTSSASDNVADTNGAERRAFSLPCNGLAVEQNRLLQRKKSSGGFEDCGEDVADTDATRREERDTAAIPTQPGSPAWSIDAGENFWLVEPPVGRVADGVPGRVDRLKGLGNAVVPQIPEMIGRAILASQGGQP